MKPVRIVWICGFSNKEIRSRLKTKRSRIEPLLMKVVHQNNDSNSDAGVWITNGIEQIKSRKDIELHIVTAYRDLTKYRQDFVSDNVHYHFVRDENSGLLHKIMRYLFTKNSSLFEKNRKRILRVIQDICPDLIHIIGAENPYYSLSLLDIPKSTPTILQLQALLVTLKGKVSGNRATNYAYKGELEVKLINRADYIGTCVESFIQYIKTNIKSNAKIINTTLAMGQKIDLSKTIKEYTFVHYASLISPAKATDIAVKAFIQVHKTHPDITLDIIGNYTDDFKNTLETLLMKNNLLNAVRFEGRLPTHDDVLQQIRKSSFALLPIKIDIVPNTLHEAMANGLPVLTTATEGGTPLLNEKRESVLISEIGDVDGLAANMIRILDDPDLAERLRQNAAITESEHANNHDIIEHWVEVYKAILQNKKDGTKIPEEFFL